MRHDPVPPHRRPREETPTACPTGAEPRLDTAEACALFLATARDAAVPLPSLEALIDWAAEAPCDRAWSEGALCRRAAAELWRDGYEGRSALRSLLALSIGEGRAGRALAAFERRALGRGGGG